MSSYNNLSNDLESGAAHSRSGSSSSSSNDLEYINEFAYNNVRSSMVPKKGERSQSFSENPFANTLDDSLSQFENFPKPISRKNVYTITGFVAFIWLISFVTYAKLPSSSKLESSSHPYNATKAFGAAIVEDKSLKSTTSFEPLTTSISSASALTLAPESTSKPVSLEVYRRGEFHSFDVKYNFLQNPPSVKSTDDEGLYSVVGKTGHYVKKLSDANYLQKVTPNTVNYDGEELRVKDIDPSYDLKKIIFSTDSEMQWRHSKFSKFYLYDTESKNVEPIFEIIENDESVVPDLSYCQWSPSYNYISFVYDNNIYLKDLSTGETTQVTVDGGENIFNGKPDWVYEEEVVASDRLLWWSPNEKNFVFVKTNDTDVPVYEIDYYTKNTNTKYPTHKPIKYPKPGYLNPKLEIINYNVKTNEKHILDHTDKEGQSLGEEFIVYDVFWLNDNDFIVKESDRESNVLHYRLYDHENSSSKVVRKIEAEKEYGGWIDKTHVKVIPVNADSGRVNDGYVDLFVDKNGFSHLGYFEATSTTPIFTLSDGDFDDKTDHLAFDYEKNIFYFTSTKQSSMSSNLYSVSLEKGSKMVALTNDEEFGYYEPTFSPRAKFMSLVYKGPDLPTQKIINLHVDNKKYFENIKSILDNSGIEQANEEYDVPTRRFFEIDIGNEISLNVLETKPKNFDPSKKYPLLVNYYGGPGSQRVEATYNVGFSDVIASSLDAIVLLIDPRGTDSKGWKFKKWALNSIGKYEASDIIAATKKYIAENDCVDVDRTIGWGWSYSGFVTLKLLEADTEQVFKYGAAVAPVTDWRLYDSIYTERYIGTPDNNEKGYAYASVGASDDFKFSNFKQKQRFLIMHGTGDDNVHIQNTYTLLDKLNLAGVENFDMKIFPDSDHSIYYHNANTIIYDKLFKWFKDAFNGNFDNLSN